MELIQSNQDKVQITISNRPQLIKKTYFENLPKILQMEISQANIKNAPAETKIKLADDLCRLLQVREHKKDMIKDWLLFVGTINHKITPGEIYLAFQMAMSRELLDDKGREFDLYPELSNNTTGKIIAAYLRHKDASVVYSDAKEKLKALNAPKIGPTEEQKKAIREMFLSGVFAEVRDTGFSSDAWLLFEDLESAGKIQMSVEDKKALYNREAAKYIPEEKARIKTSGLRSASAALHEFEKEIAEGRPLSFVVNRCRSIAVCEYLKDHVTDYETFKTAIQ